MWVNTVFILTSLKTEICEICQRTKITRAPCRRRIGRAVPRAENFGELITADHKVLSDNCESRNNHRYAVVVQDLATQWIQSYPCKNVSDGCEVMSKRTQKDAGEERVTAKSKPMMNLVSRCSVRNPNVLASIASESPGKTIYESQIPLSSWTEQQPRTGRPVMGASSSDNSEWNIDEKWSSQEWNLVKCWKQERRDPWVGNISPRTQTSLSSMTMIWTLTPSENRTFR